ncbi:Fic family protein [Prauserella aidingensis]|uniref:Fic family protein n=1 Tax=Prauserella aidingensis TaxID=387890 RepID=UPI0020A5453F|nr:Fic family protein [Prauserella aidingensis]MCP2253848.1 Fic family protein [Prauserella aidingensis]
MTAGRSYQDSHPWLTFQFSMEFGKQAQLWSLLGEAYSKCRHLTGTPLAPGVARELAAVYLVKGALASTAIEGNTLSESEARDIYEGRRQLPPSQHYLQVEIENVLEALRALAAKFETGAAPKLDAEWIREQNHRVLAGLELDEHVNPGEYTTTQLVVGNYRGAPPEDVPLLIDKLVGWLDELTAAGSGESSSLRFFRAFLAAVLGHLYLAWIHPFGDGNGRTARLLECAILTRSGLVPWVATNLLSDHYNRTRTEYYRRLDAASRNGDVLGFVHYAAEGFVDQLREQIQTVQAQQVRVSWINYVHEVFADQPHTEPSRRQRDLLFALHPEGNPISDLRRLTVELAERYSGKDGKTVTRDVNKLIDLGLAEKANPQTLRPRMELIEAFIPGASGTPVADPKL